MNIRGNKRGLTGIEYAAWGVLIIAGLMIAFKYTDIGKKFYKASYQPAMMRKAVAQLRDDAELVIVGTLMNKFERSNQKRKVGYQDTGSLVYRVGIDEIERGFYHEDVIEVVVGDFSNLVEPAIYPPLLKLNYNQGDRIRIYVNFDQKDHDYYTPGSWFTIDQLNENE